MTPSELREIEERAEKATPGPWERDYSNYVMFARRNRDDEDSSYAIGEARGNDRDTIIHVEESRRLRASDDAAFIAAARSDVPNLCAEVRRLQAVLESRENVPLVVVDDALEVCRAVLDESYSCDLQAFQAKCRRVVEWSDACPRVGPPPAALRGDLAP